MKDPVSSPSQSPWWQPDRHADRRPALLARNRIRAAFRNWFETRDFTEVECAALQVSPGNETHLHGFGTQLIDNSGESHPLYLHTSLAIAEDAGEIENARLARCQQFLGGKLGRGVEIKRVALT